MNTLVKFFTCLILLAISGIAFAQDVHVDGYTRKDGTYVAPHYRSAPDGDASNNWSTRGNTNPYTGEVGTRTPEPSYGSFGTTPSRNLQEPSRQPLGGGYEPLGSGNRF